jgi:hypothetical protein
MEHQADAEVTRAGQPTPPVVWSSQRALTGAVYAMPAVVVTIADPARGIPLAVGVLPAAILPVPGPRSRRIIILVVGFLAGLSLFVGGVLAHLPTVIASVMLSATVVGAALLTSRMPAGLLVLTLCAPLVAAGLSYDDYRTSAETFLLLTLGAAYAWLVSLSWPSRQAGEATARQLPTARSMWSYGIRLGAAAAIAYGIAAVLDVDHPGWAPAACLLVARPQPDLLRTRGVGRVAAVVVGALAATLVLRTNPPDVVYAAFSLVLLVCAAATAGSRWYITSGFTTFFVFVMLLYDQPGGITQKFNERVGETLLGVVLAYLFGWVLPTMFSRIGPPP